MFAWSFRSLWAHCLIIAGGCFLLGSMASPADEASLQTVSGVVERAGDVYRKGSGSFHILDLRLSDGDHREVKLKSAAATKVAMQALVGGKVIARVAGDGNAYALMANGRVIVAAEATRAIELAEANGLNAIGWIAVIIALLLGGGTLFWDMSPRARSARWFDN